MQPTKPRTMGELQDMSREEIVAIEDWQYQGDISAKRFIKGMIRILDNELEWLGREDSQSLRGLWYAGIKSELQKVFPEKWDDSTDFDAARRFPQYLSDALSEMVKRGEVTYRQLNIVDESRERIVATDTIEDDKILFVEKEAAYRRLEPIQEVFELTLVSGSGWEATALIEDLSYRLNDGQEYDLFILSDYDPTGYAIADDFRNRAERLGVNVGSVERIGIEPDQVSDQVRRRERFQVPVQTDSDREWLARNGIEGTYGLEIEAIGDVGEGGKPLRRIVVDALEPHLRLRDRQQQDVSISTSSAASGGARRATDDITGRLEDALKERAAELMAEREPVKSCRIDSIGQVVASVDLDEAEAVGDGWVPDAVEKDRYLEAAVRGRVSPMPSTRAERQAVAEALTEEIESGKIDVEELLDF